MLKLATKQIFNLTDSMIVSAFSSRNHGNMSLSHGDTRYSVENRKNFLNSLGIDYRDLVCAKQIHASNIRPATEEDRGRGALKYDASIGVTDACITGRKNLPLAVFSAGC